MDALRPTRSHADWIYDQVGDVLDPLAERCCGDPPEAIRPVLAQAWREAFRSRLDDAALTGTAAAISAGRSWAEVLWAADGTRR